MGDVLSASVLAILVPLLHNELPAEEGFRILVRADDKLIGDHIARLFTEPDGEILEFVALHELCKALQRLDLLLVPNTLSLIQICKHMVREESRGVFKVVLIVFLLLLRRRLVLFESGGVMSQILIAWVLVFEVLSILQDLLRLLLEDLLLFRASALLISLDSSCLLS